MTVNLTSPNFQVNSFEEEETVEQPTGFLAGDYVYTKPKSIDESKESIRFLRADPEFQEKAELVLEHLADNTTGWQSVLDAGSYFGNDDIIEVLRDDAYRLGSGLARGEQLKKAPQEVRDAYSYLSRRFDRSEIRNDDEFYTAAGDIATDLIADPITLATLIVGGGASSLRLGASPAAQKAVASTLQSVGTKSTELGAKGLATVEGSLGAVFGGTENYAEQNIDLAIGIKDQIDDGEVALSALIGAGVGGAIGFAAGKLRKKTLERAVSVDEMDTKKLLDVDEKTSKVSEDFADSTTARIESEVFVDLDPSDWESYFDNVIDATSSKVGGGERTKGELRDLVRSVIVENQGATGEQIKSAVNVAAAQFFHGYIPRATLVGKPSSILNAYSKFSNTAKTLAKKFRYDVGRTITGKRNIEEADFSETIDFTMGPRITKVKTSLEPILLNAKGPSYDTASEQISLILKGKGDTLGDVPSVIKESAAEIRVVLDEIGEELFQYGLIDEPLEKYFPRMFDRQAIEKNIDGFKQALIDDGVVPDSTQADRLIEDMLDISNQVDVGGSSSSFFSKRKLNITDESKFTDFVDNDINSVLNSYITQTSKQIAKVKVFGVKNINEFKSTWLDPLVSEMKSSGKVLSKGEREDILNIYKSATGEGLNRFGDKTQSALDWYTLGTRVALLPLATLSSVTEVLLNFSKAGFTSTFKGLSKATEVGFKTISTDIMNVLTKDKKLTRPEAWKELNNVGLAMDQAVADSAERLSGEALSGKYQRKLSNAFFKANLLDPWTKFVQLTSFTAGKDIIIKNLKKVASAGDSPTKRTQYQIDELLELGIDVDSGIRWLNSGAKETDSFFEDIQKGAARYTNEVILKTSAAAGVKPRIMSNPTTAILTQLMGYPAAFSNTILKEAGKKMIRNPVGNVPKVFGTALVMTEVARLGNYIRSHGESEKNKDPWEARLEAIARWGGNGSVLDMMKRAQKAAEVYQNPVATVTALGGPVIGDGFRLVRYGNVASFVGSKVPGYAAIKTVGGEEAKKDYDRFLRKGDKAIRELVPERERSIFKAKGGEVLDVPNASKEPDQRIDKMTGMPYDQQAGTAFVDEEDPLRRLGFKGGGEVDPLKRLGFGLGSLVSKGFTKLTDDAADVSEEAFKKEMDDLAGAIDKGETPKMFEDPSEDLIKTMDAEDARVAATMTVDDIAVWQKENTIPESQRQKQRPEIAEQLVDVLGGRKTIEEYRDTVDELFPPSIYTKENAPKFPTLVEVRGGVGKKTTTGGRGIIGADVPLEEGIRVASRLDIPAYDNRNVWAVTVHKPGKSGTAIAYGQTAILKNVDFNTDPKTALDIALGQNKGTIARIEGDWVNHNPRETYEKAIDLLESDEWVQVGMNPFKHSYFYDKATMQPVVAAEEVIQVGPLVLVKKEGIKYASPDDEMFKIDLTGLENTRSKAPLNTMAREGQLNIDETRFGLFGFGKKDTDLEQTVDTIAEDLVANTEGKELKDIVSYVGSKSAEAGKEDYKIIAEKVATQLDNFEKEGFSFNYEITRLKKGSDRELERPAPTALVKRGAAGVASLSGKDKKVDVYINDLNPRDSLSNGLNYETILHESIHAATMSAIKVGNLKSQAGTKLYKDVQDLYSLFNYVIKQFNEKAKNPESLNEFESKTFKGLNNTLQNPDELVSWGLTNSEMQKYLEGIKYGSTNAWTAFVVKIREILGLSSKEDTALSELLRVSDELLTADVKQITSVMGELTKKNSGGKVLKALSRGRYSTGKEVRADMLRADGSVKSAQGYIGPVENTVQGGTMTEVSVGMEINGKKMEVPTMVPTLTKDEIKALSSMKLEGNAKNIPESILIKAKEHALMRLDQGKSPFYQDGE